MTTETAVTWAASLVVRGRTDNPDRDYFALGAGLVTTLRGGKSGFIHYEAIVGRDNFSHHGFTAGIRFEF